MGKLLKGLVGIVAVLVVLVVAAGVALGLLVDPNDYKQEIQQAARDQAGVELEILGDIGWSVFPRLGLSVSDIKAGFAERDTLAQLASANVAVQLQPLLSGKVQMSAVSIDGLQLYLNRDKAGQVNWQGKNLPAQAKTPETEKTPKTESAEPQTAALPAEIDIESVTVSNGVVVYQDAQSGQRFEAKQINLTTGRIQNNQFIPVTLAMQVAQQSAEQPLNIGLETQGELRFDLAAQSYQLRGFNAVTELSGAQNLTAETAFDLSADMAKGTVSVNPLKLSVGDLNVTGQVAVTDLEKTALTGELAVAPFALNPLLKSLGQAELETAGDVLQKISLSTRLEGDAARINANDLKIVVDNTTLKGTAGFATESGRIFADLKGDTINLTDYLPPQAASDSPADAQANSQQKSGERYSKAEVIPLAPLQALNMDVQLKFAKVQHDKLQLSNVDVAIDAANGLVKAPRINAAVFGGQVSNRITLDARKKPLTIHSVKSVKGLDLEQMLTTLTGDAPITGTLETRSDVRMSGQSVHSFVNTLNGTANVALSNGVVKGIDMAQQMCQTMNNLTALGSLQAAEQVDQSTPFAKMGGQFNIRNGVVSNKDLKVSLDAIEATGRGSVNLPSALIDYRLGLLIQENLFKKSCSVNNKIQGIEWPVNCKGAFDTPPAQLCKPDLSVIKDIVRNSVKEKAEDKLKEKLEEKLKDNEKVKGLLKGLFK